MLTHGRRELDLERSKAEAPTARSGSDGRRDHRVWRVANRLGKAMSLERARDTPGRRLAGGAFAFLRAAELLHQSDPASWAWATCFVNIGFALELGLKGFIREKGCTEKEQRDVGHDLRKAYELAVAQGYRSSSSLQVRLIEAINPHFQDMSLRYLSGEWIELPGIPEAIDVARLLLLDVHEQCGFYRVAP